MNREEFFGFNACVIEKVHIKEMNADFFVRSLGATEKAGWEYAPIDVNNNAKNGNNVLQFAKNRMISARERLVELAVCNEDGSRFFKDGDAAQIGKQNAKVISTLYDVAARLSGISKEDLEEVVKNSAPSPEESTSSD